MALGDGIRRNIATVSSAEQKRFRDAFLALNQRHFPGAQKDFPAGGVSLWFKQDEIHQATHVHGGPAFLPWHRELCNRLEAMLREVDPDLSLHYWDWNTDPHTLFTSSFMGSASGDAGEPWLSGGFYNPGAPKDAFRDNNVHSLNQPTPTPSTWSYDLHANPADPPKALTRGLSAGAPPVGSPGWPSDSEVLAQGDFGAMRVKLEQTHNKIHSSYVGGTIADQHTSFRDPFVFLLHSNVDRIWAMWQSAPGHPERLDPNHVYDPEGADPSITSPLQPWAGTSDWPVRPWYSPENEQVVKTCKDLSVVTPPCYDTLPTFPPSVTLETLSINFNDVPAGETAARAVVFSAVSCGDVNLSIKAGPSVVSGPPGTHFGTLLATSIPIHHISSAIPPRGRLWVSYKGTKTGDAATGTVTVHCAETNQDYVIPIAANTIARPTVAVMLVLDQSGSMDWLAGIDATTKRIDILHQAATNFVQLTQDSSRAGDGVGMVSFDHLARPGIGITKNNGTGFDLLPVVTAIENLHPAGGTSIGNGVALGRATLNPVTGFDQKALVVFTDGLENAPLFIADVAGSINDRTFAIGLGTAAQVSVKALTALANHTGGRLMLSGRLSPSVDDFFRLTKFFLQVLAGVRNTQIVTDPSGYISPGMKLRIPFVLNEADIDSTVILLTDLPAVRLLIETPAGDVMDPAGAGALGQTFALGSNMSYYRFTLPLPIGAEPAQAGTWYALLEVDEEALRGHNQMAETSFAVGSARLVHGIRYNVSVESGSNLRMEANVAQNSFQVGATATLRATLSEYGIPVERRAAVRVEIEGPDGVLSDVTLEEIAPGTFETQFLARIEGVYRLHIRAAGETIRGAGFTREQLLSAAVVIGGDEPSPIRGPSTNERDRQLCELIECLLGTEVFGGILMEHHVDPAVLRACLERWCKQRLGPPSEDELRLLEGI